MRRLTITLTKASTVPPGFVTIARRYRRMSDPARYSTTVVPGAVPCCSDAMTEPAVETEVQDHLGPRLKGRRPVDAERLWRPRVPCRVPRLSNG